MSQCSKNMMLLLLFGAGMWLAAPPSFAHYLWVQEADGAYAVCRGTIGERIDPYTPSCVTKISAKASDGTELQITRTDENKRAVFTTNEKPAIAAVTSEWGDRVNTTQGKKLMGRPAAEAAGFAVVSAFTSTQFSKTLFGPSANNTRSLGLRFEIVPLADPMTLVPGTPAAFQLLFDGRPLAETAVLSNSEQESKTDESGMANFIFAKKGVHLLYAVHQLPADKDSGLDFLKYMTFLTFEVKE